MSIDTDENWTTQFIPWLENNERNIIGTEDGVLVVRTVTFALIMPNNFFLLFVFLIIVFAIF